MFYSSAVLAVFSIVILLNMPETLPQKQRFTFAHLKIGKKDIYTPNRYLLQLLCCFAT
jgi:hypothetical protein